MTCNECSSPYYLLELLYGTERGREAGGWLRNRLKRFHRRKTAPAPLNQRDAILITYGDQFKKRGERPLQTLAEFSDRYFSGLISGMHILPFYPWSSDDGFAVVDYREVDQALGTWRDIDSLGQQYSLMFDGVINHVSAESSWFKAYLEGDDRFKDFFITIDPDIDLSQVVRPRISPLLTRFETTRGPSWVWTTFTPDQVDLNYHNPAVLMEIVDILLTYVEHGARLIRLDAIAYLWKEIGTSCIHLPQAHLIVNFLRAMLDEVAPYVLLITETNVPHEENVSYFGDGYNEAQMIYNFALPPLVFHAFSTGKARILSDWAASLTLPSTKVTFFNFLASHDGIGLNPARGILAETEIEALAQKAKSHGGLISSKTNRGGSQSPYELNVNYFNALSDPQSNEPLEKKVQRFLAAHAILLALVGLPGIYIHSVLGSLNWMEGVQQTGRSRTINRRKFEYDQIIKELETPDTLPARVFKGFARLLRARSSSSAFHPYGAQLVMDGGDAIFAVQRIAPDGKTVALCFHNVSTEPQSLKLDLAKLGLLGKGWRDLLSGELVDLTESSQLQLDAYQVAWLLPC